MQKRTKLDNDTCEETCENENKPEEVEATFTFPLAEEPRIVGLYGDVDEEHSAETIFAMLQLKEAGKQDFEDEETGELVTTYKPFEFMISTWGGVAQDAFAIYDIMRMVKESCEIHTFGVGKVMSAGVLLLAAGTKGKRKIGANCRVMLHGVMGASHGAIHNLENEMEEIKWVQKQYVQALVAETDMTEKHLKRLLGKKIDVYLTAEEAVDLGIADEIV